MSSLANITITPIFGQDLEIYWPDAAPLLSKAIDHTDGEWTMSDIHNSLKTNDRALWVIHKDSDMIAAVTTRIDNYPSGKRIAVIDFAGGRDWNDWAFFTDYVSPLYKDLGCGMIEIAGRLGWMRLYAARGFKPKYLVLRKEL